MRNGAAKEPDIKQSVDTKIKGTRIVSDLEIFTDGSGGSLGGLKGPPGPAGPQGQ